MKRFILILLIAGWGHVFAQKSEKITASDHISKKFTLKAAAGKSTLALYNTWGSVKVEGYNGSEIIIEADETIHGRNAEDVEKARAEFKAGFIQTVDSIIVYTAAPQDNRPGYRNGYNEWQGYYVELDYTVKVPNGMNINVATVNNGDVSVNNVYGLLSVRNVNGPIAITNAKGATNAHTVNGNLSVTYLNAPADACSYYTLNGKLEVTYPAGYTGDVQFKSFNGQFYTDFDNTQSVATEATVEKNKSGATTYRLNKNRRIRIGNGGKLSTFETLNGNIYLKRS